MADPLIEGTDYIKCELTEAADREMIVTLEDFLRRPTVPPPDTAVAVNQGSDAHSAIPAVSTSLRGERPVATTANAVTAARIAPVGVSAAAARHGAKYNARPALCVEGELQELFHTLECGSSLPGEISKTLALHDDASH